MKARDFAELLGLESLPEALDAVADQLIGTIDGSAELAQPAIRMLEGGGKRLRPLLTIASAVAAHPECSVSPLDERVRAGAASVELVHVGSLVHDDIIDAADTRRGVETVNSREGANQAVLVGDFLLARAGIEAARVSKEVAFSLAVTISDLCDGQSLEGAHEFNVDRTTDQALASIAGKTGALLRASCHIGALCVGELERADALAEYGMQFGMAFQLVDDLLDLVSTDALMGKPVNNDAKSGVYTYPVLVALAEDADPDAFKALMLGAKDSQQAADELKARVLASSAVTETLNRIGEYNKLASACLSDLPDRPTRTGLMELPERYLNGILTEKSDPAHRTW